MPLLLLNVVITIKVRRLNIEVQMKLLRHWQQLQNLPPSVVTIGNFDGVHRGHQAILQRMLAISRSQNLVTVVMLFEPQPQDVFSGQYRKLYSSLEEYERLARMISDMLFLAKADIIC